MPKDYDARKRPWYKSAVEANAPVLSGPYVDAVTNNLVVSVAVPVKREGKLAGFAASDFALTSLVAMIKEIDAGPNGYAFLVNKEGRILIHPDAAMVSKTLADLFPTAVPTITADVSRTQLNGVDKVTSFVPVRGLPSVDWYLGIVVDSKAAYASVSATRVAAVIATVLAVASMIGFLILLLSRMVIKPVTQMTSAMEQLAAGNLNVTIPGHERTDQIGYMASAVAVFRTNALERQRLEGEAERNRTLTEQERAERESHSTKESADIQFAVDALAEGLTHLSNGALVHGSFKGGDVVGLGGNNPAD